MKNKIGNVINENKKLFVVVGMLVMIMCLLCRMY